MRCRRTAPEDELTHLFREVALVLGGVFAVHRTNDATIEAAARGLKRTYQRARSRTSGVRRDRGIDQHPAIAELLRLIAADESAP